MMVLTSEDLPAEIWLNIFSYFEGHELVRSFSCLNPFFNSLLRSSYLKLHFRIRLNESNRKLPDLLWSHINFENICSLAVGRRKANCLLQFLRWHASSLKNLSFLSVYIRKSADYQNIELLLTALSQLPSLNQIRIKYVAQLKPAQDHLVKLLNNIFKEKFPIEKYSLMINGRHESLVKTDWSTNPMIKSLYISAVTVKTSLSILSFVPEIQSLEIVFKYPPDPVKTHRLVLHHLRKIHLHICAVHFAELLIFRSLAPNLETFLIDGLLSYPDENYFDENMWNQLLNNLKYFRVKLSFIPCGDVVTAIIRDYITRLHDKSWFSHDDNGDTVTVVINFKSVVKYLLYE